MKVLSLNTWGGRIQKIDEFVHRHAADTDVFCFQEMYSKDADHADPQVGERSDFFQELQTLLPDFIGIFAEQVSGTGIAAFIRNSVEIENTDSTFVLSSEDVGHLLMQDGARFYPRLVQTIRLKNPHIAIYNFHGVPGDGKRDTKERYLQMKRLHEVLNRSSGKKILMGDFNLNPDNDAIRGVEKDMRNLVMEGGFQTTRTTHYSKREAMPFADYTFVSWDVTVVNFEVLADEVSDHSPMSLIIED